MNNINNQKITDYFLTVIQLDKSKNFISLNLKCMDCKFVFNEIEL